MKTLKEVQAQFESKNKAGQEVNILAYHPDQDCSIIGENRYKGSWHAIMWSEDGVWVAGGVHTDRDLVKRRAVLPKDILCDVWGSNAGHKSRRYFDGKGRFFPYGSNSLSSGLSTVKEEWDNYRVIENPPQPWFGGECPIPEGCDYKVRVNNTWVGGVFTSDGLISRKQNWKAADHITAYQILGEKESK